MPNKKVKIAEKCVITSDDKGQRTLVSKAKEVLTTLSKKNVDVTIYLDKTEKDAAEKFLNEHDVPFKELITPGEASAGEQYDACVLTSDKVVLLRDDWQWAMEGIVSMLYGEKRTSAGKSEQQKMDDKFTEYKKWAEKANSVHIG